MQIPLNSPGKKMLLLAACLLFSTAFFGFCLAEFAASYYSTRPDLASLHRGAWLQPGNAEYRYRLGRYFTQVEKSPQVDVDFSCREVLMAKKNTAAAAKVCAPLTQSHQNSAVLHIFERFRYLIVLAEVEQAHNVWQEGATLCGLTAYRPTSQNLFVNGDFSLDVL